MKWQWKGKQWEKTHIVSASSTSLPGPREPVAYLHSFRDAVVAGEIDNVKYVISAFLKRVTLKDILKQPMKVKSRTTAKHVSILALNGWVKVNPRVV